MNTEQQATWYSEWFDSPYYHILYQNHDITEAELFIDNLAKELALPNHSKIADIACGRGRHAMYLNKKGYDVTGLDLSVNSIEFAQQYANHSLQYHVHDMREIFATEKFDAVVNLFTSFGYFEAEEDNYTAMAAMAATCKKGGKIVIDFMNTDKVLRDLVAKEIRVEQDIVFKIARTIQEKFIVKNIQVIDLGKQYNFQEQVRIITLLDFQKYFISTQLTLLQVFGNYNLEPYSKTDSDRMIFILQKN